MVMQRNHLGSVEICYCLRLRSTLLLQTQVRSLPLDGKQSPDPVWCITLLPGRKRHLSTLNKCVKRHISR